MSIPQSGRDRNGLHLSRTLAVNPYQALGCIRVRLTRHVESPGQDDRGA